MAHSCNPHVRGSPHPLLASLGTAHMRCTYMCIATHTQTVLTFIKYCNDYDWGMIAGFIFWLHMHVQMCLHPHENIHTQTFHALFSWECIHRGLRVREMLAYLFTDVSGIWRVLPFICWKVVWGCDSHLYFKSPRVIVSLSSVAIQICSVNIWLMPHPGNNQEISPYYIFQTMHFVNGR